MRRMIPEKAQKYIKDLATNHPDPSASWGGTEYTAGNGIDITEGEISVNYGTGLTVENETLIINTDTIATKNDLNNYESKDFLLELTGTSGTLTSAQVALIDASDGIGSKIKVTSGDDTLFFVITDTYKDNHTPGNPYMYLIAANAQYTSVLGKSGTDFSVSAGYTLRINYDYDHGGYTWGLVNFDAGIKFNSDFTATWDNNNILTVGLANSIPTTATSTSTSTVTPSTVQLTFTYSDNTTETITLMTGASVSTTTTTTLS